MVKVTYHWIYPTFDPGHSEMFFFCWKGDRTEQKIGAMKKKKGVRNVSRRQFRDSCDPKSILSTSKITTAKGSWRLVSGQRYAVVLMKLQNRDIAWRTIIKFDWNWADSCIHLRIVKSSTVYLSYVVWRVVVRTLTRAHWLQDTLIPSKQWTWTNWFLRNKFTNWFSFQRLLQAGE